MGRAISLFAIIAAYIALMALLPTESGLAVTAGLIAIGLVGDDLFDIGLLQYMRQRFRP